MGKTEEHRYNRQGLTPHRVVHCQNCKRDLQSWAEVKECMAKDHVFSVKTYEVEKA